VFIKYYSFDWLFLFTNAMWIIGGAFILTVISYAEFLISRKKSRRRELYAARSVRNWLFIGFILVVSGYALSPNEYFIAKETLHFVDLKTYDIKAISARQIRSEEPFSYQDIEMLIVTDKDDYRRYPFDDATATIIMGWDGLLGTPFVAFEKGEYALEFEASGSEAGGEFAKILVFIVTLKKIRLSLKELLADQDLSAKRRLYSFTFQAEAGQVGKARIQFHNDALDEKGGDRNVFIGKIKIKKIT
jgi:hypothetical protein